MKLIVFDVDGTLVDSQAQILFGMEAAFAAPGVPLPSRARQAVMVGDTVFDMDMARAAGLHGLGVAWGYHPASQLGPHVIDDFIDLDRALRVIWNEEAA